MLTLLEKINTVLRADSSLVALLGSAANIGTNLRKSPALKMVEFGPESGSLVRQDKDIASVRFSVYGTDSVSSTTAIADRVTGLMTPRNLNDAVLNLKIGSVRRTRYAALPVNDFGHQIELVFEIRIAE